MEDFWFKVMDSIGMLVLGFTSFGSCVVQFGCYTVTNLDAEGSLMPLSLKLH